MQLQIEVVVQRGAIAESRHSIQAAVCDAGTGGAAVFSARSEESGKGAVVVASDPSKGIGSFAGAAPASTSASQGPASASGDESTRTASATITSLTARPN